MLRAIVRTDFTPGARYAYTNSNYVVLGGVIEKVTRGTVERAFRTRIAGRARLTQSTFVGDALFEGSLLRRQTLRAMTRPGRFGYGLGIYPERFAGRTWIGHDGSYAGYGSDVWHDATRHLTIAVTTNQTPDSSTTTWTRVATAYDRAAPTGSPCRAAG